jgi:hypothetical protein
LTPETFFQGRLTGWGVVRNLFGRVLRRFTIEMEGHWSYEHRALHLDETYSYVDGPSHQRRWAIHTDEQGFILGHDALEVARMRGRQMGTDFQITFDRPRRSGSGLNDTVQVVRFIEVTPDQSLMLGAVQKFGVTIATTHVALKRTD